MTDTCILETQAWVQTFVLELGLCPFAARVVDNDRVRYVATTACEEEALLVELAAELTFLSENPAVETTLLIHPHVLADFQAYNQFLDVCDALLEAAGHIGEFQIASFHPQYQFAETQFEDAENYSNRSPYPMLHILREASVAQAVDEHTDVDGIPLRNIEVLEARGSAVLATLWQGCFQNQEP